MIFKDHVQTTINTAVTLTDTAIVVDAAPSPFNAPPDPAGSTSVLSIVDSLTLPTKIEQITYTGRTGTGPYTLTGVTRGNPKYAWSAGSRVFQSPRAADMFTESLPQKSSAVGSDIIQLLDSQAGNVHKKMTFADMLAFVNPVVSTFGLKFNSTQGFTGHKLFIASEAGGLFWPNYSGLVFTLPLTNTLPAGSTYTVAVIGGQSHGYVNSHSGEPIYDGGLDTRSSVLLLTGDIATFTAASGQWVMTSYNANPRAARAWVNFEGSTGGIRSSFNVGSITRLAAGQYTVNFSTAMADGNYAVVANGTQTDSAGSYVSWQPRVMSLTTNSFRIHTANENSTNGAAADNSRVMCVVFGNRL